MRSTTDGFALTLIFAAELNQVLLHELAHISRYDDWMIMVQRFIEALFIFHPLVRFVSRRIDLEREMACDDYVISFCRPRTYAACLTKMAELTGFGSAMALNVSVPLLARKSHLAARVEMMLDRTWAHKPAISLRFLVPFAISGMLAACGSFYAPALIAFPLLEQMPDRLPHAIDPPTIDPPAIDVTANPAVPAILPMPAIAEPPAPNQSHQAPKPSPNRSGRDVNSITITSPDGATTTMNVFKHSGDEHAGQRPFPRGTIVFRQNGRSYIIRDRATLDAAQELLKLQQDFSRHQRSLSAEQQKMGTLQAKLAERQAALAKMHVNTPDLQNFQQKMRDLEAKLHSMDFDNTIKTAHDAQVSVAGLQTMLAKMQASLSAEQSKEQGRLAKQLSMLGQEQGRLGEHQARMAEQQAREAKRMVEKLQELIRKAQQQGLAQPLR